MRIGIIGFGVVGKAAGATFSEKYALVKYDKFVEYDKFEKLLTCSFVFVMVPTPFDCKKNEVDDSAILETLERLESLSYKKPVIIKSTVPPGRCDYYSTNFNLEIVFNPEFLRESMTPDEDFKNQDTIVIGTSKSKIFQEVRSLYEEVLVPNASYYHTSFIEAEMIKCSQNTMLASRVALANMFYDACKEYNVDYDRVKEIAFDRFKIIGKEMTQVPGPDGNRGFGGKCLPKDTLAFSTVYSSELLQAIISYNSTLRDDLDKFLKNYK